MGDPLIDHDFVMKTNRLRLVAMGSALAFSFGLLGVTPAAQERSTRRSDALALTLQRAVELARERSPLVEAGRQDVKKAQFLLHDVRARAYFPDLSLNMQTGVVPGAQGDIFWSPDRADELDDLGPFVKLEAALTQPIFTFGKASSATAAAAGGLDVAESGLEEVRQDLAEKVIQAYWAVVSADEGASLAEDLRGRFDELIAKVRSELDNPFSTVDDTHLLEARTYGFDVDKAYAESLEQRTLALSRLALLLDFDADRLLQVEDVSTPEFSLAEEDVDVLVQRALRESPRVTKVRGALGALDAKVDLAKANRYPNVFLAGGLQYGYAGHRTDQTNPFAVDNFNYRSIGLFVGFNWNLNFVRRQFEIGMQSAERNATAERLDALTRQVTYEVVEALSNARRGARLLASAKESLDAAETWLRLSLDNWDLGLGEIDRVFRAYDAYYRLQRAAIEQEFEFNASLARLAAVQGDVGLYLTWVENGTVAVH